MDGLEDGERRKMPMKMVKKLWMSVLCFSVLFGTYTMVSHAAEDELNHGLPEVLTGMDENGNVYELDPSSGYIETVDADDRVMTFSERDGEAKIVNFNTKGFSGITEYKEVSTGISGYVCGAYGADAAYLGTSGNKVKFMLSGVIGEVAESEVQVVNFSDAQVVSHYMVSDGRLYHKIATKLTSSNYGSTLEQGKAPSYMSAGTKYYSYDGHYFYSDYKKMLEDYQANTRAHAINPNTPYYNYFQFLPLRSKTNYSGEKLNEIINRKVSSSSKMRNLGETFVQHQNTYGVNALLMTGVAANESAWGTSNISQNKNNLFGLNAVDSSPGQSANYYADVKVCVKDFAEAYMSKQYLNPNNWKYYGAFLGNKGSGINLKYASDPYWGEKAANVAWVIDKDNGRVDDGAYTIGVKDIKNYEHTPLNVRKEASASSTKLYGTGQQSSHTFLILGESGGFYKIQCDGVLTSDRSKIDNGSGVYDYGQMYAYASKDYITSVITATRSWSISNLATDVQAPQAIGTEVKLTAQVNNVNSGLQYKFVWMKDDWNSWGVIRDFSDSNTVTWKPEEGGNYKLYVDVRDGQGKIESCQIDYRIKNWGCNTLTTNLSSPQGAGTTIEIRPQIIGSTSGLKFKFVWEKNDWADWGVIQQFSTKSTASWTPKSEGDYTLYVDIEDSDGVKMTKTMKFIVENWELKGVNTSKSGKMDLGETLEISADVSYPNSSLQYKFVWMKNDWADWGVIRDFSSTNQVSWTPESSGDYTLYVDVKDAKGVVSKNIRFQVIRPVWSFESIAFSVSAPQRVNTTIQILPQVSGSVQGLKYKYVWQKNDWADWGVIKDFSSSNSVNWKPTEEGQYKIYVDVMDLTGKTVTKEMSYEIGSWEIRGIQFSISSPQTVGKEITIQPMIGGDAGLWGLEYKFVWMKEDWADWGVIQPRSSKASATWRPNEPGDYTIYVDVFDKNGYTETYKKTYQMNGWGIAINPTQSGSVGTETIISMKGLTHHAQLQYKFVWMKDDWDSWGVIQEFSENQTAKWTPNESGTYSLYVDVEDKSTGIKETKSFLYEVR